ncbi:oxidoreductase [Pseudomonas oryzihabitans]|uniref:phage tail protein n=1 Tax=Pseudomonas rhizoryzae TaxID=2571129 RepID=UPI0007366DDD|nr:phage tail protein [Pseudomonas rhizoryzae]KTS77820.1 oxidoreductase [Pseudomonas psychrotolerans]KTT38909.1 oxidoreductase [Pseudomonas psychrotolerans]KTT43442.1 oxidoreductase [Pseudomonas psychrotolerans]KTT57647.1 oxidoreductase [Pseudomonas psychrotolerans]KTT64904.1 oxidoreductase [Pseudomonas psychrotolerans]
MMMALGTFVFSLHTLAYNELNRTTAYTHAVTKRVGAQPARQFVGKGDDSITLPGWLAPELAGSPTSLDLLRLMASTGSAWPLIEGSGRIYGLWVIESLNETKTIFFSDGTPRRIGFTLTLKRIDDNQAAEFLGTALAATNGLLRKLL